MEKSRGNIKRTKKGTGATVKLVGIQIDNDLLPYLNALPNKSRFINDLLRKNFFLENNLVVSKEKRTFASLNV